MVVDTELSVIPGWQLGDYNCEVWLLLVPSGFDFLLPTSTGFCQFGPAWKKAFETSGSQSNPAKASRSRQKLVESWQKPILMYSLYELATRTSNNSQHLKLRAVCFCFTCESVINRYTVLFTVHVPNGIMREESFNLFYSDRCRCY